MRDDKSFRSKKLLKIGALFIFFFLIASPFFSVSVKAVTTVIENWDSYGIGSTSGSNGIVSWELTSAPFITVLNYLHSAPAMLYTRGGSVEAGSGWINKTYTPLYESSITIYFNIWSQTIADGGVCSLNQTIMFKSVNGANLFYFQIYRGWTALQIWATGSTGIQLYNYDTGTMGAKSYNGSIKIQPHTLNLMTATLYNATGGVQSTGDFALIGTAPWANFSDMRIQNIKGGVDYVDVVTYIDDIIIGTTTAPTPPVDTGVLHINFYDLSTGTQLYAMSNGFACGGNCPPDDYFSANFRDAPVSGRRLWPLFYSINSYPDLTADFINLHYTPGTAFKMHYLDLTNISGKVAGVDVDFNSKFQPFIFTNGTTITVYLVRVSYNPDEGYTNTAICYLPGGLSCAIGFNKINYSRPDTGVAEVVLYRYRCPTTAQLHSIGWYTGTYYMFFKRDMNWWDLFPGWDDYIGRFKIEVEMTNDWIYGEWTPVVTTDNFDEYTPFISSAGGFLNPATYLFTGQSCSPRPLHFYTANEVFVLSGNITNVVPNPANVSDTVSIYYDTNNPAYLRIVNDNNHTVFMKKVATTSGIAKQSFYPTSGGYYYITLLGGIWAFSPFGGVVLDTASLYVMGTGYNTTAEYLICSPSRAISGLDKVTIIFNTYKADTLIKIISPKGERSIYSRVVQPSQHKISFLLESGTQVGAWLISMQGNETLNSSFDVIAEYGNYVDFRKGSFYSYEPLTCFQTHTEEVDLVLYKDGEPLGGYIHFSKDSDLQGTLVLLSRNAENMPQWVGTYKLEMWEVKDGFRQRLLSVDTTRIIYGELPGAGAGAGASNYMGFDIIAIIDGLPEALKAIFGAVVMIAIMMAPFIIALYLSRDSSDKTQKINIPPLVYLVMLVVGEIVSVLLHFFPFYVPILTVLAIVMGFIVLWLYKPKAEASD